ncbi:NUDIX hydrolase [Brevibacillus laterosporus]|uniref:NUDIX hydrolase n=1 Tax=Brevibacillus laterosporus TaxID=1465 RepID=UPI000CE2C704|nr:NUDIX hydrolase [Brevibacillus laterosporus]AYB39104.1 NUDIX hydrolase [Brevibacillus laterosporus]MBG9800221.1 NUDIX hydrolase [Brevibacillus laterosporus]MBM7109272.1 Isopentenyl-diphosphate Delta-isomerase [Brevibacillus laterosporus]MED1664299.1 NUDIX hydrolase [Brevibacillus laterosporus]MED1668001.1 NUDIX hydrolase [Brevibacillus laterosporus]
METELLAIFDESHNQVGSASRAEVHSQGLWHETFHCWFISTENGIDYIHFQIRSEQKKDFPSLLDITAAGHLLAHETIHDGIREVEEELGIHVSFNDLVSVGVIKNCIIQNGFIDKELSHVFLYQSKHAMSDYTLQPEEVSGMVKAEFAGFCELWLRDRQKVLVEGFEKNTKGESIPLQKMVGKDDFVPHEKAYFESVIHSITQYLSETKD